MDTCTSNPISPSLCDDSMWLPRVDKVWGTVVSAMDKVWGTVVSAMDKVWGTVVSAMDKVWGTVVSAMDKVWGTVVPAMDKVWGTVVSAMDKVWGTVVPAMDTLDCILLSSSGPNWLKNLYFTYLVVLRALTKAGTYWESQSFYTGDTGRDILVKEKIMTIVNAAK